MSPARELQLLFPDGKLVTGRTFAELEEALRASQFRPYKTRRAFRRALRHRAEVWSGRKQKPVLYQTPKAFIYSLVNAGLCMLVSDDYIDSDDAPLGD